MPPALHSADRNGGYQGKADKQRSSRPHTISSPQFPLPTAQVCVHTANIPADRKPELAILHIFMSLWGTGIYLICNSGGHLVRGGLWWKGAVSGPQQLFFSSPLTQTWLSQLSVKQLNQKEIGHLDLSLLNLNLMVDSFYI